MNPRFHVDFPLSSGFEGALPAGAARHVQVLRLQPGETVTLFDGRGRDWPATIVQMGRTDVRVQVGVAQSVNNELPVHVTLAVGMPANDRMDWLIEKATELGASAIQPLVCERSVLRLTGERAQRKQAHWQAVAVAAAEQCGRAVVPQVRDVAPLAGWLRSSSAQLSAGSEPETRLVLSLHGGARRLSDAWRGTPPSQHRFVSFLSGPEGGLTEAEDQAARSSGFAPVSLGPRVLRAETAPLAALVSLATLWGH